MIFDINDPPEVSAMREIVLRARLAKQKVGITSGCFDLFHDLHRIYLERCRRKCDFLIVGVDSDDLVRSTKGEERPLIPEHQRVAIVDALKYVDAVFVMDTPADFGRAVDEIGADVIFKNDAFIGKSVHGDSDAKVLIIPDIKQPDSTSAIVEAIIQRRRDSGSSTGGRNRSAR